MEVIVSQAKARISVLAAQMIATLVKRKPRAVIGLATGSTPLGTYRELIRMHKEEGLDFSRVVTFNLDEYVGLPPTHGQSYRHFMDTNLFSQINIRTENTHLPDGMAPDAAQACRAYEDRIRDCGGIDLQLLGIGANGHIAFNEPGSPPGSRTRVETLTEKTRSDNSRFFRSMHEVPRYAITMGIGTIMEAHSIILLASGRQKAEAVAAAVEGPVTAGCPASALQLHASVTAILDRAAAGKLKGAYPSEPQKPIV